MSKRSTLLSILARADEGRTGPGHVRYAAELATAWEAIGERSDLDEMASTELLSCLVHTAYELAQAKGHQTAALIRMISSLLTSESGVFLRAAGLLRDDDEPS